MTNWQTMLFSPQGRIRRRDYWLWSFVASIVAVIFLALVSIVTHAVATFEATHQYPLALVLAYCLLLIPLTWINLCLGIKRWHDRNKSGWWYLIIFIPFLGAIWSLVECGFLDGTKGPNAYGPSPKGLGLAAQHF